MKDIGFEISNGELFCLAAIRGYGYLLNVDYEPEESGADLLSLFNNLTGQLRNKKLLDEDFDGNITVTEEMQKAISLCAAADRFWVMKSHLKKETISDHIYTVYNRGDDYLVLEQIDGVNYKGLLTTDPESVKESILIKTPFTEAKHQHTDIHSDAVEKVIEDDQYSLITVSGYSVDINDGEKSFLCHTADMFLFLDNGGSYKLTEPKASSGEETPEDSGIFLPIHKQEFSDRINSIFTGKEDI